MRDKISNVCQTQTFHRALDQRVQVRPQAARYLLEPLLLEGLLDLREAAFHAVELGTIGQVEDDLDAQLLQLS